MMKERGLDVDHSTVFRWVQRYAPELNKRIRPHLKMSETSYRVDETCIKVGKSPKYLCRAVDKAGQTIEFMLSAKRDVSAAKRFFKKVMRAEHRRLPFSISVDNNAAYPEAFGASQAETLVPKDCLLRRVKYLNNVIEQDHRFIKKKVRASKCFKSFHTAERTLRRRFLEVDGRTGRRIIVQGCLLQQNHPDSRRRNNDALGTNQHTGASTSTSS